MTTISMKAAMIKYSILVILFVKFILAKEFDFKQEIERSFYIDYDRNTFMKDGQPFQYLAGSIHSYRMPKTLWKDRLMKLWSAGLNAIDTYVYWNEHEPYPGVYDFEGQNNIFEFFEMAHKIGFLIVLRPGPYICGEHEYGGLPWWLLANGTENIRPRSNEKNYMYAVKRWLDVLFPKLKPYLYKNGGPIITVQIENEYGSLNTCDHDYTLTLRDMFMDRLGKDVVYFTTDGYRVDYLECGSIPGVHATVDFGVFANITEAFENMRKFSPKGPLINSEYYPGWLDIWGVPHQKISIEKTIQGFHTMMSMNASINFYMYFGGTNFGYTNGADPPGYIVQPTTYDYDAPISEAGDLTLKHEKIKEAISKYYPARKDLPELKNSTKVSLGKVPMKYYVPLVKVIQEQTNKCINSKYPLSFEKLGQGYGFVMYKTILEDANVNGMNISIEGVRDRAYIQLGDTQIGIMYRQNDRSLKIKAPNNKNRTLYIIVENMGRLNFGNDVLDAKGILSNVTLDGKILTDWTACLTDNFVPYYQKNLNNANEKKESFIRKYMTKEYLLDEEKLKSTNFQLASLYIGDFIGPETTDVDTFLKIANFNKGVALLESERELTNLGKYWPKVGPQLTLYTPGIFLTKKQQNYVALIEFEQSLCGQGEKHCQIEFIDYPIIDIPINPIY